MLGAGTRVWGKSRRGEPANSNNNNIGASPIRAEEKGPTRDHPLQPRAVAGRLVNTNKVHWLLAFKFAV
jgi:hypothetical protein